MQFFHIRGLFWEFSMMSITSKVDFYQNLSVDRFSILPVSIQSQRRLACGEFRWVWSRICWSFATINLSVIDRQSILSVCIRFWRKFLMMLITKMVEFCQNYRPNLPFSFRSCRNLMYALKIVCAIKGSPVGRPLICFTLLIADFSNFDRFVLGP